MAPVNDSPARNKKTTTALMGGGDTATYTIPITPSS